MTINMDKNFLYDIEVDTGLGKVVFPARNSQGQFSVNLDGRSKGAGRFHPVSFEDLVRLFADGQFREVGSIRMKAKGDNGPPSGWSPIRPRPPATATIHPNFWVLVENRKRAAGQSGVESGSGGDSSSSTETSSGASDAHVGGSEDRGREVEGTGYESDPAIRKKVEDHAVDWAKDFYKKRGYAVQVMGKPYDLHCTKPGEVVHVEVKGSRSSLEAIIVTINEVNDARDPQWRSDLCLVDNIVIEPDGQGYRSSGGRWRQIRCWVPEDKDLTPTQFRCKLPPISDAE